MSGFEYSGQEGRSADSMSSHCCDSALRREESSIAKKVHEMTIRPSGLPEEKRALAVLARTLATNPYGLIDQLLEEALPLCNADSSGLSVLETLPNGEMVFRWTNMAGTLKQSVGGSSPRCVSPSGLCLDQNSPQRFAHPARRFQYLKDTVEVPIVETLVVPVPPGLGTPAVLWIVTHEEEKSFHPESVRIMDELADFAGSALGLMHSLEAAQKYRDQAEAEISQRRTTEMELRRTQEDLENAVLAQHEALRQREIEITSRKRSEGELQKSHDALESLVQARTSQLRQLSGKLLILQDEERRRIARDLHDSAGQYLSGIQMNLDACLRENSTTWVSRVAESRQMAEQCLAEIRTMSYLLHPPLLDEVGLLSALSWYAKGFSERSGIRVDLDVPDGLGRLPAETEAAIFRMLQEALSNVHRHSKSKTARISITSDAEEVILEVSDEGCGIPAKTLTAFSTGSHLPGVGIAGMRERVSNMGGKFGIRSSERGTTIEIILPMPVDLPGLPDQTN
ncbi:MAG: ATP-binding protein [Candidatus Acidiferrales bacterium]